VVRGAARKTLGDDVVNEMEELFRMLLVSALANRSSTARSARQHRRGSGVPLPAVPYGPGSGEGAGGPRDADARARSVLEEMRLGKSEEVIVEGLAWAARRQCMAPLAYGSLEKDELISARNQLRAHVEEIRCAFPD
jgi:hypothetical protein